MEAKACKAVAILVFAAQLEVIVLSPLILLAHTTRAQWVRNFVAWAVPGDHRFMFALWAGLFAMGIALLVAMAHLLYNTVLFSMVFPEEMKPVHETFRKRRSGFLSVGLYQLIGWAGLLLLQLASPVASWGWFMLFAAAALQGFWFWRALQPEPVGR